MTGPNFSRPPCFNHIAVSVEPDELDASGRTAIVDFLGDLFGAAEYPEMTRDRARLVLGLHTHEQFFFVVAEDEPMRAARMDHVGVSVGSLEDFHEVARRAAAWHERFPDEVELIEPSHEDFAGVLRLHSFYVRYRLPLMLEVQHFEVLT
ncbi:MAG: hypothetical protein KGR17_00540 [Acidobacteria bacterium]|nr:hypothetical protein [Acidobacteriota bacterium]